MSCWRKRIFLILTRDQYTDALFSSLLVYYFSIILWPNKAKKKKKNANICRWNAQIGYKCQNVRGVDIFDRPSKLVGNVLRHLSRNVQKRTCFHVRPTETQTSLCICTVGSESSLSAWRNFDSLAIQNAPSEDSDQTARMRRLILRMYEGAFSDVAT